MVKIGYTVFEIFSKNPQGGAFSHGPNRVNSKSIQISSPPFGQTPGNFLKGRILHPPVHKESAKPRPRGRKIVQKPHPHGNYFQKSSKKQYSKANMLENSETYKSQSFLAGGFYGYLKYLKSFSIHV